MHCRKNYDFLCAYIYFCITPLGFLSCYSACAKLHCSNSTVTLVSSIEAIQIYNGMTDWNLCNDSFPEKLLVWGKIQYWLLLRWKLRKYDKHYLYLLLYIDQLYNSFLQKITSYKQYSWTILNPSVIHYYLCELSLTDREKGRLQFSLTNAASYP